MNTLRSIVLKKLSTAALARAVAFAILPEGRSEGQAWIAPSPHTDPCAEVATTIRVDLASGEWADSTFDDWKGKDPLSLFAHVHGCGEKAASRWIAETLGIDSLRVIND